MSLRAAKLVARFTYIAGFLIAFPHGQALAQSCPDQVIQGNRAATIFVKARTTLKATGQVETRTGTGFVISPSGYVLTDKQVIEPDDKADEIEITGAIASREASPLRLELLDANQHDIALLKFKDTSKTYKSVSLGQVVNVKVGTPLCSEGFPTDKEYFFAEGPMSGTGAEHGFWFTQMPSNPGDSGAPVFVTSGEVVAIKVGDYGKLQNVNLLIPMNLAQNLLPLVPDLGPLNPQIADREKISLFLRHMCNRGVLFNRWQWEIRSEVYVSITEIGNEITHLLDALPADSPANNPLLRLQKATRQMIQDPAIFPEKAQTRVGPINDDIGRAIDSYRTEFATNMDELERSYKLDSLCEPTLGR